MYGRPRKEFLAQILRETEKNYFSDGLRTHLQKDYYDTGTIVGENPVFNFYRSRFMKCLLFIVYFLVCPCFKRCSYSSKHFCYDYKVILFHITYIIILTMCVCLSSFYNDTKASTLSGNSLSRL